jgi:hypothetical protein
MAKLSLEGVVVRAILSEEPTIVLTIFKEVLWCILL